ncbi:MAG: 2-oxoacid:acceptor oxidoreductase family protein [Firmicutes bacterium]|jgi:oxalate oxidoreductase subunit delta|nr:2-oxoacid:acceptor oxidoreductase family protein [Bacillota bacterium]
MSTDLLPEQITFADEGLKQVTVWSRGVLQNKEARDVAVALAMAAGSDGKFADAWENYVDLPDRVNVPVRSYARISSEPIEMKYVYVNNEPDIVVLLEETLVKGLPITEGLKPGGTLVVNTRRDPAYIAKFVRDKRNLAKVVCVDASGLGQAQVTLSGAEGATDATGIAGGWAGVLVGAVARATGLVSLEALKAAAKRPELVVSGYDSAVIMEL